MGVESGVLQVSCYSNSQTSKKPGSSQAEHLKGELGNTDLCLPECVCKTHGCVFATHTFVCLLLMKEGLC